MEQFNESTAKRHKSTVKRLLQSTYVDDVISGVNSDEEAFQLYKEAKAIFQTGGFSLRKFLTNSFCAQAKIGAEGVADSVREEVKVLGTPTMTRSALMFQTWRELPVISNRPSVMWSVWWVVSTILLGS